MKVQDVGNERENCIRGRTSAWFKNLSPVEQERCVRAYFKKIRSLEQPLSDIDLYICQAEAGIAEPDPYRVPSHPRPDVK